jgi:hypothetical protein
MMQHLEEDLEIQNFLEQTRKLRKPLVVEFEVCAF